MKPLPAFLLSLVGYSLMMTVEPAMATENKAIEQFEQGLLNWDIPSVSIPADPPAAPPVLEPGSLSSQGFIYPIHGAVLTSGYGPRWGRMHRGIDLAAPTGTPIVAAAPGRVAYAGWNEGGYGYLVEIDHPDGSKTRYAHNSRILVKVGDDVNQGQLISEVGSTGNSTGPHLHFEIHTGKGAINPLAMLPKR